MAYPTHPPFDKRDLDMVFAVWLPDVKDGSVRFVPAGEPVPKEGEIVYAGCADGDLREQAEAHAAEHLHRWRVAHRTHLRGVK